MLVHERLPSMEHVDLLLHLVKVAPEGRSAAEAAAELRVDNRASEARLRELVEARLARSEIVAPDIERFYYEPAGLDLRRAVEQLVEAYQSKPVSLIRTVYERPAAAQQFADAFRLRKSPP